MRRKLNTTNYASVPIDDWLDFFNGIFQKRNDQLRKENEEYTKFMWLKVIEHSTRIAEAIRKRAFFEAVSSVARVFCWTCGFVQNNSELLEIGGTRPCLSDILWHKYPRVCSYCAPPMSKHITETIRRRGILPCSCEPSTEDIENKRPESGQLDEYRNADDPNLRPPHSLNDWSNMIGTIYAQRCSLMSLESICFHFLEEVGEVLTMMQMIANFETNFPSGTPVSQIKKKLVFRKFFKDIIAQRDAKYEDFRNLLTQSLRDEIADVLSWLFSLVKKLLSERESFLAYEKNVLELIENHDELRGLMGMLGHDIRMASPTPPKQGVLTFASIAYVFYAGGCPMCKNFEHGQQRCLCDMKIPTFLLTDQSKEYEHANLSTKSHMSKTMR